MSSQFAVRSSQKKVSGFRDLVDIALKLKFIEESHYLQCIGLASEVGRMLLALKVVQKNNSANRVLRTAN